MKGWTHSVDFVAGRHLLLHLAWCNLLPILRIDRGFWNLFKKESADEKSNLGPHVQIRLNLIHKFPDVSFHICICTKPFFIWLCMYWYLLIMLMTLLFSTSSFLVQLVKIICVSSPVKVALLICLSSLVLPFIFTEKSEFGTTFCILQLP